MDFEYFHSESCVYRGVNHSEKSRTSHQKIRKIEKIWKKSENLKKTTINLMPTVSDANQNKFEKKKIKIRKMWKNE